MALATYFTIGEIGKHFGCPPWHVRRTIARGFMSEPPRVGCYRIFTRDDLPRIQEALRRAGYLREGQPCPAA